MKSTEMNNIIKELTGIDTNQAIETQVCPFCKEKIYMCEFRDPLSEKEFQISGLCQDCQDEMFGG